jgi:hypothetical protein
MKRTLSVKVLCVRLSRRQNSTHFDEIWYEECPEINWVDLKRSRVSYVKPILHKSLNSKFIDPERASVLKMGAAGSSKMSVTATGTTQCQNAEYRNRSFHLR